MVLFVVNFLAYTAWFFYVYRHERTLSLYSCLILLIVFIAFAGVYTLGNGIYFDTFGKFNLNNVDIEPFLYTFVGFVMLFHPLKYARLKTTNVTEFESNNISLFIKFWVILTFAYTIMKIVESSIAISIGLDVIYEDRHMDGIALSFMKYKNPILAKISWIGEIVSRTTTPIMLFYSIINIINYKRKKISIIIMILAILPSIINSIAIGSRGAMVWSIFKFLFIIIFLKDYLSYEFKKIIILILSVGFSIVLVYSILITVARVGQSDSLSSILRYFGEPFPNMINLYWDNVINHPNGLRFFSEWFNYKEVEDMSPGELHNYWGDYTGVPILNWKILPIDCYIEYGVVGGLLFIFALCSLFSFYFSKYQITVYNITILFFYYEICDSSFTGFNASANVITTTIITIIVSNLFLKIFCNSKSTQ